MNAQVQPRPPAARSFGPLALALGIAAGFLCGVLLVAILGGAKPVIETRTITVPATRTTGGTVIVSTRVPALVGQRLDVALARLERARFTADVEGGGLFGVVEERNWEVVEQSPAAGTMLEQGSQVTLGVQRD
ncbi:MAG TPA: PASTA domain-containing protein [Solirubrobacteraceae bacterium]|nr:PASTA domain-containing protein [Solirubrobacteraceae bacterium]